MEHEENLIARELSYKVIGLCMEVHNRLGRGFNELVYQDALEYELKVASVSYSRERTYQIRYKDAVLHHVYKADFVIEDTILFETKAVSLISDSHVKQVLNCLAASGLHIGLLVNFGADQLRHRKVLL
jgi:GxxExxY protein